LTVEHDNRAPRTQSRAAIAVFGILFGLTVLFAILSLPVGVYAMFFTTLTPGLGANTLAVMLFWVGPIPIWLPFAVPLGLLFVSLVAAYASLIAFSASRKMNVVATFSAGWREGVSALLSNDLVIIVVSIGFLTFTAYVVDILVAASGVQIGELTGSTLSLFFSNTSAPLVEEFGFRVCIIGLVALFLLKERSPRALLEALWRPASTYEGEEIRAGKVSALAAVLVASATIFGILHILSGSGWEIGKLPEATYGGLVLGYLYIKYGFHVAVLTHWGIDYFGSAFSFFGQGAYGIPWGSVPGYALQQIVSLDLIDGIGLASFLLVIYLGVARLRRSDPVVPPTASTPDSFPTSRTT
jgi:hypothetical protein